MRLIDMQVDAQVAAQNSANFTNIGGVIQAFTCIDLAAARCIESSSTCIERSPCIHRPSIASPSNNRNRQCTHRLIYIAYRRMILQHDTNVMHAESNCMSTHCHCIAIDLPLHPRIRRAFVPYARMCTCHAHCLAAYDMSYAVTCADAPRCLAQHRSIHSRVRGFGRAIGRLFAIPALRARGRVRRIIR